jgi:hypothetical protein
MTISQFYFMVVMIINQHHLILIYNYKSYTNLLH